MNEVYRAHVRRLPRLRQSINCGGSIFLFCFLNALTQQIATTSQKNIQAFVRMDIEASFLPRVIGSDIEDSDQDV
ncbi:Uncharacterized protein APZ42_022441 [Daphnia magna]|uniref:Uncharacterized protein n=1 Tax=Daphnia magna TaxID=35525 RepID=A0A164VHA1_9CRUS|nr:Uncharacterized protein APZ42_022441 [Daphnia magna]